MGKKLLTTDSTLSGYIIMSIVCTLYVYQESALNHMDLDPILTEFWHWGGKKHKIEK